MALFHVNFASDALKTCVSANVIIPQNTKSMIGIDQSASDSPCKTLWLLHGLSDDYSTWMRRTSVERYALKHNLCVVMPSAGRSFYTDSVLGKYYTYISEELPSVMRNFFRCISPAREDNYIAGLSMGGFGAMKIGLSHPERYAGIASFSGCFDLDERTDNSKFPFGLLFGSKEEFLTSNNNVFRLAENCIEKPRIYIWCGTEDSLLDGNRKFAAHLERLGYQPDYNESPGVHRWEYWDQQLEIVLDKWFEESGIKMK